MNAAWLIRRRCPYNFYVAHFALMSLMTKVNGYHRIGLPIFISLSSSSQFYRHILLLSSLSPSPPLPNLITPFSTSHLHHPLILLPNLSASPPLPVFITPPTPFPSLSASSSLLVLMYSALDQPRLESANFTLCHRISEYDFGEWSTLFLLHFIFYLLYNLGCHIKDEYTIVGVCRFNKDSRYIECPFSTAMRCHANPSKTPNNTLTFSPGIVWYSRSLNSAPMAAEIRTSHLYHPPLPFPIFIGILLFSSLSSSYPLPIYICHPSFPHLYHPLLLFPFLSPFPPLPVFITLSPTSHLYYPLLLFSSLSASPSLPIVITLSCSIRITYRTGCYYYFIFREYHGIYL